MRNEKKRKSIHYKLASITDQSLTLQELLTIALSEDQETHTASKRMEQINPDDEAASRLINRFKLKHQGMLFGQLVRFEAGRSQVLMTLDLDAESYSVDTITSDSVLNDNQDEKERDRRRREFIDSILYFGVLDNHLVVMQSQALTTRELEAHLAWLLAERLELLGRGSVFMLIDKITEEVRERVVKTPVKSVNIGTPVETKDEQTETKATPEIPSARGVKYIPSGQGADILAAALGKDWFNELKLEDSLDEANLQVQLKVTYLRKTSETGQKMLDDIASTLRHIDSDDVSVDFHGGGKLVGNEIRLNGHINVMTTNGIVDENDLFHQMHNWLVGRIEDHEIDHADPPESQG